LSRQSGLSKGGFRRGGNLYNSGDNYSEIIVGIIVGVSSVAETKQRFSKSASLIAIASGFGVALRLYWMDECMEESLHFQGYFPPYFRSPTQPRAWSANYGFPTMIGDRMREHCHRL
jgi:hypothetical protein